MLAHELSLYSQEYSEDVCLGLHYANRLVRGHRIGKSDKVLVATNTLHRKGSTHVGIEDFSRGQGLLTPALQAEPGLFSKRARDTACSLFRIGIEVQPTNSLFSSHLFQCLNIYVSKAVVPKALSNRLFRCQSS